MTTPTSLPANNPQDALGANPADPAERTSHSLVQFVGYFLGLGTWGFGGPIALAGYMRRDLVESRSWLSEDDYALAMALAQIMPGPLAAQLAIALGYFRAGVLGATLVGLAFVVPSWLMVLGLSLLYVQLGGLWWMQALFYSIGATVIAIITIAAYKLARGTNKRDPLSWGIFVVLALVTAVAQAEIGELFILAGLLALLVKARPSARATAYCGLLFALVTVLFVGNQLRLFSWELPGLESGVVAPNLLLQVLLFFMKAGAFVFGSGLAIIPFLQQGAVQEFHWLTDKQFLDAVAVAMITPGPVVITVAFIGYLAAGLAGAVLAAVGIFLPVYFFTIVPAPWFRRHANNPQLAAFARGATAAATGAIAGAVIVLAGKAIYDVPTLLIGLASLAILLRWKVQEPMLVMASGLIGLVVWPLVWGG
jgi:chromate transporter